MRWNVTFCGRASNRSTLETKTRPSLGVQRARLDHVPRDLIGGFEQRLHYFFRVGVLR
jgi:hypothetical protein